LLVFVWIVEFHSKFAVEHAATDALQPALSHSARCSPTN